LRQLRHLRQLWLGWWAEIFIHISNPWAQALTAPPSILLDMPRDIGAGEFF
jgi:hypothetical protein